VLKDGSYHQVDSSELAFRLCTIGAFREAFAKTKPVILEPIMTVEVVAPVEFQSAVIGSLNSRRGTIIDSESREDEFTCVAEVALNDMFGYSNQIRGVTQGKGEFSMEYKVRSIRRHNGLKLTPCYRTTCLCSRTSRSSSRRRTGRRSRRRRNRGSRFSLLSYIAPFAAVASRLSYVSHVIFHTTFTIFYQT
jgi:translation elongation factor EF-G